MNYFKANRAEYFKICTLQSERYSENDLVFDSNIRKKVLNKNGCTKQSTQEQRTNSKAKKEVQN